MKGGGQANGVASMAALLSLISQWRERRDRERKAKGESSAFAGGLSAVEGESEDLVRGRRSTSPATANSNASDSSSDLAPVEVGFTN